MCTFTCACAYMYHYHYIHTCVCILVSLYRAVRHITAFSSMTAYMPEVSKHDNEAEQSLSAGDITATVTSQHSTSHHSHVCGDAGINKP